MTTDLRYETKTVQAVRGAESLTVNKWARDGWKLVSQDRGRVRTTLTFRRTRKAVPWRLIAVGSAALAVLVVVGGVAIAVTGGGDDDTTAPETSGLSSSEVPSASASPRDEAPRTPDATATGTLTAENSAEFAQVLTLDYCDPGVGAFAAENAGATLEFDGSVTDLTTHESYDTRFDILVGPGDEGPSTTVGPVFKFEDVGIADLNLTGDVPDALTAGDLLRVTATVRLSTSRRACSSSTRRRQR